MFAGKNSPWIMIGIAAASLAACATTGSSLENSSERLEKNALELQDEAHDRNASSDYRRDAQELANEARDFRRTVSDRDANRDDVGDAFHDLSQRYHALRDDTEHAREPALDAEFKDVTDAYLDIERAMQKDHDRYVRD